MPPRTFIRWFGHATVLINWGDTWIITDPVLRHRVAHLRRRNPIASEDWPSRIDVVLISHMHWDHLDLPTLRDIGKEKLLFVPRGAGEWLDKRGFSNVRELEVGDRLQVEDTWITAVPARHSGWRPFLGPTAETLGYVIDGDHQVYFPGDTDLFAGMTTIADNLDIALMPVWGWGRKLGSGHLDPFRAAEAVFRMRPDIVIPIHWGTFHPIGSTLRKANFLVEPPEIFERAVNRIVPETDVRILRPGEDTTVE
ncbi:MAG: MBL fold metallo-hydrolase [Thermomicrobiales bacterium]